MSNIAYNRIKREFSELPKEDDPNRPFFIAPVKDNMLELTGYIVGPSDTPFEGGNFHVEVKIPETYPFNPPKVKFTTRIWHPNISSVTGVICLDILKDQWAAAMTLRTVMLSIQALLSSPEPDDPQDAVVARQYKDNPDIYRQTARYWTYYFATKPSSDAAKSSQFSDYTEKIRKLSDILKIDTVSSLVALSHSNWNVESAMQNLL